MDFKTGRLTEHVVARDVAHMPVWSSDLLAIPTRTGSLVVLQRRALTPLRTVKLPSRGGPATPGHMQARLIGSTLAVVVKYALHLVTLPDGQITSLTAVRCPSLNRAAIVGDGSLTWSPKLSSIALYDIAKQSTPWSRKLARWCVQCVSDGPKVFVQDGPTVVRALDAASGQELWSFDLTAHAAPGASPAGIQSELHAHDGRLLFASGHHVFALDGERGALVWSRSYPGLSAACSTLAADGTLVSVSSTAYHELDTRMGDVRGHVDIDRTTRELGVSQFTAPSPSRERIFTSAALTGELFVFARDGFELLDRVAVHNTARGKRYAPAVPVGQRAPLVDDAVWTLDMDGVLRAFR